MTTSARAPRFGDFGTLSVSNGSNSDASVPRRPEAHTALSSGSATSLSGIWANDPVGGLSALRRGSADDDSPASKQGSNSLMATHEHPSWSRRSSQWSAATAPAIKALDSNAPPRRGSAYPSAYGVDVGTFWDPARPTRQDPIRASSIPTNPFDQNARSKLSSEGQQRLASQGTPTRVMPPAMSRTNSWSVEPSGEADSQSWNPPNAAHNQSASKQIPGLNAGAINASNISSFRWNGHFGGSLNAQTTTSRPPFKTSISAAHDQSLELSSDLTRLSLSANTPRSLLRNDHNELNGNINATYAKHIASQDVSREPLHRWSQSMTGASGQDSSFLDSRQLQSERPRPSTSHIQDLGNSEYPREIRRQYQQSPGSYDYSITANIRSLDLHHSGRPPLEDFGRQHLTPSYDYMYSTSQLQSEEEQRQLALWNASMLAQYSTPQYNRYNPSRMAGYGMPAPAGLSGWPPQKDSVIVPQLQNGQDIASTLMMEFHRSNAKGGRRYELRDIFDHVVEFAGDQHGSRFIQQKLETANSDDKQRVFTEIQPNSVQLMKDVFGNYVIQKFFEHGDQNQKKILASYMKGQILDLSLNVYGCRVVQKALEHVLVDQQASMVGELYDHVLRCVRDQNGNHVIQMAIQKVPGHHIGFIIDAFIGQVQNLATHSFGCRVVQRLLEHCQEPARAMLLRELHDCALTLMCDQYGNYVTQHVIEHGRPADRQRLIGLVKDHLIPFSKQKYASNVVEKSIIHGTDNDRHDIMLQFAQRDERGETALPFLLKDGYGNYVIQKLLDTLTDADHHRFLMTLEPELRKARSSGPNKQVENVAKKMCRVGPGFFIGQHSHRHESLGSTPPMTANGTPSPQSSSIPSTLDTSTAPSVGTDSRKQSGPTIEISLPSLA